LSLRLIPFKKSYSSDYDDILFDFYIPALEASVQYDRLAGFFSSTSLAVAARGILGLVKNNGVLRLIVSPKLSARDIEVMIDSSTSPEKYIEEKMLQDLENLENQFIRDHVYALGWLMANSRLQVKVGIVYGTNKAPLNYKEIQQCGLFHQKVGILRDKEGNTVTFSGSVNESATGWLENIEEFKVFRSWEASEREYVDTDVQKFERFWNDLSTKVRVIDIPSAVRNKLIELAPSDFDTIGLEKWYSSSRKAKKVRLLPHQQNAIELWWINNRRGIFEMATGVGKTYAALGCLRRLLLSQSKLLAIITCPYHHLVVQWKREIDRFGINVDKIIVADSTNPSWKKALTDSMIDIVLGYHSKVLVLTTHVTFSSRSFCEIIERNKANISILVIGDEVHGLGAFKSRQGLLEGYNYRLGLSATPKRWFDSLGTQLLYEYFGDTVYEFGLREAVSTINPATGETYLTPYRYIPKFVSLTEEELVEYMKLTRAIASKISSSGDGIVIDEHVERFLYARANVVKNAIEKYRMLEEILEELGKSLRWTLIYCSPQQIDRVMKMLNKRRIVAHRFTMDEGVVPEDRYGGRSEREFILEKFAAGDYQVLVAMRCLDEGVDVPQARVAILMSSSGNPREYTQRIGRVLRRYPGKNEATVYDIIVKPSLGKIPPELKKIEERIFKKELLRYREIAKIAMNNAAALLVIDQAEEG